MSDILPFVIAGVVAGSVYGLAAVGLVLSYRTSGIFNFAHGALATLSAYVFYALHVVHGVAWPLAAAISALLLGPALGLTFERLALVLARSSLIAQVVGTVGVLLVVEAACTQWYGSNDATFPNFLPQHTVAVASTFVTVSQIIIVAISIVLTLGLTLLLRLTRLGRAMRAVVDDPDLLAISGISPATVRRSAWVIGCFFVTLSGLLLAPNVGLDASALTLLVIQAFGAAAIGRFSSLPWTWVGGEVIGVGGSLISKYANSTSIWSGLPTALPFLVLFGVLLLVRQRGRIDTSGRMSLAEQSEGRLPAPFQLTGGVAVLGVLIAVPWLFPGYLTAWMGVLTDTMLFLSLGLLVRASRQVSLCQITFAAVGAVAFSKLAGAGVPWLVALLVAGLIVVPIGAVLAIPAVRLSGLYLALATLGFGLLVQAMFYESSWMFGLENLGLAMPRPHLSWLSLDSDRGFYFLLLLFVVGTSAVTILLLRGRLGALLRVLGESPLSLEAFGVNITVTRILVFCLSAFIAAIAGALSGSALGTVTGLNFDPLQSLSLFVLAVIVAGGEPWYALSGALVVGLIPAYFTSQTATDLLQVIFGVLSIGYAVGVAPRRPAFVRSLVTRIAARRPERTPRRVGPKVDRPNAPSARITASDVTVRFGGLTAIDGVSITAESGRITGIIGPNGAGKTTLFNVCSGLISPTGGTVALDLEDVTHRRASRRARMGLGRTFQQIQLCESLTVEENVRIGVEGAMVGANVFRHIFRTPRDAARVDAQTTEALELAGVAPLASRVVRSLPTGQRRLVELARCLAGSFTILLLDEPSSGLDAAETNAFGALLRRVVAERSLGILLIEHDLALTMEVCDELYVLDFGKLIFHGSTEDARRSTTVQTAYLGDTVMA